MMRPMFFRKLLASVALAGSVFAHSVYAEGITTADSPAHGIAMYGSPALPQGFGALPYAKPDAPKGGALRLDAQGGFDSLNAWILAGRPAEGVAALTVQTLLYRSLDEPFTLYGLLAEAVATDAARSYVEFTLNPAAKFSDGSPVTVEDVLWSFETLGTKGHPRYATAWKKVAKAEAVGARGVRFTFTEPDRELALLMGLRPILKKAQWEGRDFAATTLEAPIGSGPYVVDQVEAGRRISFKRDPNWWGKDLPVSKGLYNFDTVSYDYFADQNVAFEAFKAGEIDVWRETNAARWGTGYDFPRVASGAVKKVEIGHQRPSGIQGLVFNTRKPQFSDPRVREALILAYNFEFISKTLNADADPRIGSYFDNSVLSGGHGPAEGKVAELLAPFAGKLPQGAVEGYALPSSDGSELNRANTRKALKLLAEAGWTVDEAGQLKNAKGEAFAFEILLQQGKAEQSSVVDIYVEALGRLGIAPQVTLIDDAQYQERTNAYDFDMAWYNRALSLSPGNEQMLYWGAKGVEAAGSRNWMGMNEPAAEAMIAQMLATTDPELYRASVQALDRILLAGRYVIPNWYQKVARIAYAQDLHYPLTTPLYGDWPGFLPDAWWFEKAK